MAYTVLIQDDNTAMVTATQGIIQNSKLVDVLQFIVPKAYGSYLMADFDFFIEYKAPISHKVYIEEPVLSNSNYKTDYLLYTMDIDTNLTAENGDVPVNLYFTNTYPDADGNNIQRVRRIEPLVIKILPVSSFFAVPDEALDTIVQLYLANQQQINSLSQLANTLNQNKADDITIDSESNKLRVTVNGTPSGTGVDLDELANEMVEQATEGNARITNI